METSPVSCVHSLLSAHPFPSRPGAKAFDANVQMLIIVASDFSILRSASSTSPFEVSTPSRTT